MDSELVKNLVELLQNKKLKNVEAFDLKGKSELVKFIILATAQNEKAAKHAAVELEEEISKMGKLVKKEGEFPGDWIILDLGEVLIEIFTEDSRTYYNLEKLWGSSKNRVNEPVKKGRKTKTKKESK